MSILDALQPSVDRDAVEGFDAVTLAAGALEATFVPALGMAEFRCVMPARSCSTAAVVCAPTATREP
jgi:hypothetical protein